MFPLNQFTFKGLCAKVCVAEEGGKRQLVAKQDIKEPDKTNHNFDYP